MRHWLYAVFGRASKIGVKNIIYILYRTAFIVFGINIIWRNWASLVPSGSVKNIDALKTIFLQSPYLPLITIGSYIGILVAIYFLLQMPFLNITQLKVFGVEYTKAIEHQEQVAQDAYDQRKAIERVRMNILNILSGPLGYDRVVPCIDQNNRLDMYEALDFLSSFIEDTFRHTSNVPVHSGVVRCINGTVRTLDYPAGLHEVRYAVKAAFKLGKVVDEIQGDRAAKAIPVNAGPDTYIFWLQSSNCKFTDSDELMVETAICLITNHADTKVREDRLTLLQGGQGGII